MTDKKNLENKVKLSGDESLIAGKSLSFYWQTVKWFILLLIVLEVINITFNVYEYGHWIIEVFVFIVFSFWLLRIRRLEFNTALVASIFIGIGGGIGLAIFEIIWFHEFVYLLSLIIQPFIITVVGAVSSFTFFLLFKNLLSKRDNNKSKGGGIYDSRQTNVNSRFR
ncbi:MAG: hypothetical protein ACNFW9_04425 [Candidatus Kerfeldbacteria bacterium]|jgi:hypothetical protein